MNRPIKFRVWHNAKKKWIHGPGDEVNLFGETILLGQFMPVPIEELNDCVAEQFTGILDKNGKEIYEGDIIRDTWKENHPYGYDSEGWDDEERTYPIEYKASSFSFRMNPDGGQVCTKDFKREVIGNIHETT